MLYHCAHYLQTYYSWFNVLHYVSVRASAAFLSSLICAFVFGNWFIQASQRLFRAKVRPWTPASHQAKNDTPTMGGLLILFVVVVNALLWCNLANSTIWIFLSTFLLFGAIGFWDDYQKIRYHKGISSKAKFRLQVLCATVIMGWWYSTGPMTMLCVPFLKNIMPDLGILLIPWGAFIIVATSNAVNLTDGLDGLATGPLIACFGSMSLVVYLAGHKAFAQYLYIPFAGSSELAIVGAILVASLLGFLWYNTYPAQIFMGDVGSLALGAGLALMGLMARQELLLIICGGIFVLETLSVIIQVTSIRLLGRRVFKMAPIHHHFELLGWQETKITVRFWIISIILAVITLLTLKLR